MLRAPLGLAALALLQITAVFGQGVPQSAKSSAAPGPPGAPTEANSSVAADVPATANGSAANNDAAAARENASIATALLALSKNNETAQAVSAVLSAGRLPMNASLDAARRIIHGKPASGHPYIVYLQMNAKNAKLPDYKGWVCGGAIVSEKFVLTSAACVEDAVHFYVVSGTNNFVDGLDWKKDDCVKTNRRRVVWKCVPKAYIFEASVSTRWMADDIAIVKVGKPFSFGTVEAGCEFAAEKVVYNNFDQGLEATGTKAVIMGWGSKSKFRPGVYGMQKGSVTASGGGDDSPKLKSPVGNPDEEDMARQRPGYHSVMGPVLRADPQNSKKLLDTNVAVMDKEECIKIWPKKFSEIIRNFMICTNDTGGEDECQEKYAKCSDVKFDEDTLRSMEADYGRHRQRRRFLSDGSEMQSDSLRGDFKSTSMPDDGGDKNVTKMGGFCENDHGGPMVTDSSKGKVVIGVISACKIDKKTNKCRGPFLYTSVWANRNLITCIVDGEELETCRRMLRLGENNVQWNVTWMPGDA